MVVYKITNKVDGKVYIGLTTQSVYDRFRQHTYAPTPLGVAIRKYGETNFNIDILAECSSISELRKLEREYIAKYNSKVPNGYNQSNGGECRFSSISDIGQPNKNFAERRAEIVAACEKLCQISNFSGVTLQKIGNVTTCTRTAIYDYFKTKEEIFLALLQKEYELWIEELNSIEENNSTLTREEFADQLAWSLENRKQLLRLMSMNQRDMEAYSRLENLIEFKRTYGNSLKAVKRCLDKFFVDMTEQDKENFLYAFFPFVYGIYPYAVVSEKQTAAMNAAGTDFVYHTIYDLAYNCITKLLAERKS